MRPQINSKHLLLLFLLILSNAFVSFSQTDYLPVGATVNKLSTNQFGFLEGPVWYEDSVLLFTDQGGANKIYKYNPQSNVFSVFRENSQKSNGLTLSKDGELLACEETTKKIVSIDRNGNVIAALATSFNGTVFNKPNDLIADAKGGIYFTDPPSHAVYYVSPTGVVSKTIVDLTKPNGILLSPDGLKLYVSDTQINDFYSWTVAQNGTLSNKVKLATLNLVEGTTVATADGMAIDIHGNIYVTTGLGVQVISASGTHLGTITVPEQPANCDFGGPDMKTLYITARTNVYKIDLNYPGYTIFKNKPSLVDQIQLENTFFTMFPVPANASVHYKLNERANHEIVIYNSVGKCVKTLSGNGDSGIIMTENLANGIYFAKLTKAELKHSSTICRFVIIK